MKKITIFLLTFLFFVGFINVFAQNNNSDEGGDGPSKVATSIMPMFQEGIRCSSTGSLTNQNFTFQAYSPTWTFINITNPMIHYSEDGGVTWNHVPPTYGTPDNVSFGYTFLTMSGTVLIYAEALENGSLITSWPPAPIYVVEPPKVTLIPSAPLAGIMCKDGDMTFNVEVEWDVPEADGAHLFWRWTHNSPASVSSGVYDIEAPFGAGENIFNDTQIFYGLTTGAHSFDYYISVEDKNGYPSAGSPPSCDEHFAFELEVVDPPVATISTETDEVCEGEDVDVLVESDFTNDDWDYTVIYGLYLNGDLWDTYSFDVDAGDPIADYTFTIPGGAFRKGENGDCLERNRIELKMGVINRDPAANVNDETCFTFSEDLLINVFNKPEEVEILSVDANPRCDGEGPFELETAVPSCGTGTWSVVSGSWSTFDPSDVTILQSGNTALIDFPAGLTVKMAWTVTNGACDSTVYIDLIKSVTPTVDLIPNLTTGSPLYINSEGVLGVCEYEEQIEINIVPTYLQINPAIYPEIFNGATEYEFIYTLYINGVYNRQHNGHIDIVGNDITLDDIYPGTWVIDVAELDPCLNEIVTELEVFNTDPDVTFTATCKVSDTLNVTVWSRPITTVGLKVQEACSGEEYEVKGFATPQECGATSFNNLGMWLVNSTYGGIVNIFPDPGIMDSILYWNQLSTLLTVIDSVEFLVRDDNGCWSTPDTAFITIRPLPVIDFDYLDIPNPICYNHDDFELLQVFIRDEIGNYYVCPTDAEDCGGWWTGDGVYEELDADGDPTGYWFFSPKTAADVNGGPGTGNWIIKLWYHFTNEFGCTDSLDIDITVFDLPVIPFEYDEPLCAQGNAFPIFLSGEYLPTGPILDYLFVIDPPTGLVIDPHTGELFLVGATPGEYVITYWYTDGNCSNVSTDTIIVHPLPKIDDIELDVIPCIDQTATLTVHVSDPADLNEVDIQWWNMTNPPTYIPAPMGNGVTQIIIGNTEPIIYKVIVTNKETHCYDSLEFTVQPTPNPVETITFNMLPGPYCNNSVITLDATILHVPGFEGTVQNIQWGVCEYDFGGYETICYDIPLTDLKGQHKIEVGLTTAFVRFYIDFNTEGYNCPDRYWSDPIEVVQTIKVDLAGASKDTVCHGGSVELTYNLSNIDPSWPIWYRILENGLWLEGVNEVHQVPVGSTQLSFTTNPSLHENENGPQSYCYAVEVWQYPVPYVHLGSPYPAVCFVTSDCYMITVLKDPELLLTCPGNIIKLPAENPIFTANLVGGNGDVVYQWYLNTVLVQEGPENTYELDDLSVLSILGDYTIAVKAIQQGSGCDAKMKICEFSVVCPPMQVSITGPDVACVGDEVRLTAVVITDSEYTLQWKKDGQILEGKTDLYLDFTVGEDVDIEQYEVNVMNCGCQILIAEHIFQVLPKTVIWVDNYTICENGAVEVTVNQALFGTGQVYRYLWFDADGEEIDITYIPKKIFKEKDLFPIGTDEAIFSVQAIMLNAVCSSNVAEFSITKQGELEPVELLATDTIICVDQMVKFTLGEDNNIATFGAPVYTWWIDGIPVDAPSLNFLNISFAEGGMHYVNVHIAYPNNICEFLSNEIAIEVRSLNGVTIAGDHYVCNAVEQTSILAVVNPSTTDIKYQWYLGEELLADETGATITVANEPSPYAYIYYVKVTDTVSGCTALSAPFEVWVEQFPTIAIHADKYTICPNDLVELTADVPFEKNMLFEWLSEGVILGTTQVLHINPDTTATYTFTATQIGSGCTATSNEITITVIPAPVIAATKITETICQYEQVTFTATLSDDTPAPVIYTWLINGTPQSATEAVFTYNFNSFGDYEVQVFATTIDAGCKSEIVDAGSITVKFAPSVTIAGDHYVCNAVEQTSLLAVVNPSATDIKYQWYLGLELLADQTGATITVANEPSPYAYIYYVRITDTISGCSVLSDPFEVWVEQFPTIGIHADKYTICPNELVELTADVPFEKNMLFEWLSEGVILGTTQVLHINPDTTATYTFTATQIGSGCTATSNEITITVIPAPVIAVEKITETICQYKQLTFTATLSDDTPAPVIYTWLINGTPQSATEAVFTYNFNSFGDYEVQVFATTINAGCKSEIVDAGSITVKFAPSVTIDGPEFVCNMQNPPVLLAKVDPISSATLVSYQWYLNNEPIDGGTYSTQQVSNIPTYLPYNYYVIITDPESGCEVMSATHQVKVEQFSMIGITVDKEVVCAGDKVVLTADVTGNPNTKYIWYANNDSIGNAPICEHHPLVPTTYKFIAIELGSNCVANSNEQFVMVEPIPSISIELYKEETICQYEQVSFKAILSQNTPLPVIYTWLINGTPQSATEAEFTYNFNSNGQFDVKVFATTVGAGCSSLPISAGSIYVKPAPSISIDGPHAVCDATIPTTLKAKVFPLDGNYGYQWYLNGNPIDGATYPTLPVSNIPSATPYYYYVIVTDLESGCSVASETHEVIVNAFSNIAISPDPGQLCLGESFTMGADVEGLYNMIWQWYEDNLPLDGENSPILNWDPSVGPHTYYFIGTQIGTGCTVNSNIIPIFVAPIPEKPSLSISETMICSGNSVTVSGNIPGNYVWYEKGFVIDGQLMSITTQPTNNSNNEIANYEYQAKVIVSGCMSSLSDPVSVAVHPAISVTLADGAHEVCEQALGGEQLVIHALVTGLIEGVDYQYDWYYLQGYNPQELLFGNEINNSYVYVPNNWEPNDPSQPYHIYVKVKALGYNCTTVSSIYNVNILEKPTVVIDLDVETICIGGTVTATAIPTPTPTPENPYNYIWSVNGVEITGYNIPVIPITEGLFYGMNEISVRIERSYGSASCFGTGSHPVLVVTPPALTLYQDIEGNPQLAGMCVGGKANLSATVVDFDENMINVNDFAWEWRLNGEKLPWIYSSASPVITTPGTYIYEVRAILNNNLGCNTEWFAFAPIKVVPQPTVSIYANNYNYYDVCEGATIVLNNELGITDPTIQNGYAYKWNDLQDWEAFPIAPRSVTFNSLGKHTFFLTVEFENPTCQPAKVSDILTYTVVNNPVFTEINIDPDNYSGLCKGETVTLDAKFIGGVNDGTNIGLVQWMYSFNNEPYVEITGTGGHKTHKPAQAGYYTYMATYVPSQAGSGCSAEPKVLGPIEVYQSVTPAAEFAVKASEIPPICGNNAYTEPVKLPIVFDKQGTPPFDFVIKGSDGSLYNLRANGYSYELLVSPKVTTTYTIESLKDVSKCVTGTFVKSDITVTVTDIEVLNPYVIACSESVDVNLKITSVASKTATIDFMDKKGQEVLYTWKKAIQQLGSQNVITIDIPSGITEPGDYPVIIKIDGCEYKVLVYVGKPSAITANFKFDYTHPAKPQICSNNPAQKSVELLVTLTGTPPFNYLLVGTDGTSREITSFKNEDALIVSPTATTTYTIEWLLDNSACQSANFEKPEVTVYVTEVEFINPDVVTCNQNIDIEFYLISSVNSQAILSVGNFTKTLYGLVPGYNKIEKIDISEVGFGTHKATLSVDGCDFSFTITSNFGGGADGTHTLIHKRWEGYYEVLVVSNSYDPQSPYYNGGYNFTSYQWYKDGKLIPGATQQHYQDPSGVANGIYTVHLTGIRVIDGSKVEFTTCGDEFIALGSIKVYPVPAQIDEPVWVDLDLTPAEIEGAYLDIYDAKGAHVKQVQVTTSLIQIEGFKTQGAYYGKITTGTHEIKAVRFLIVK